MSNRRSKDGGFAIAPRSLGLRCACHVLLVLAGLILGAANAGADSIAVGAISFDIVNPGATNAFTVYNLTGSNSAAPDFPVTDNLTFNGATVTATDSSGSTTDSLGDVGPGAGQVFVLSSDEFSQAVFSATLSQTIFELSDGTTFQADSNALSVTLLPASPPDLVAGQDFALITVTGSTVVTPAPEPSTWLLLLIGVLGLAVSVRARQLHRSQ
jgi:PEP-CTERM motif